MITKKRILFILAAGNSTRFLGIPKELIRVNNKYNIENTLEKCFQKFDKIYIVTNKQKFPSLVEVLIDITKNNENKDLLKNCETIYIESGFGSGDAIIKMYNEFLKKEEFKTTTNDFYLLWGDAYITDERLINLLIRKALINKTCLLFPIKKKIKPYCSIKLSNLVYKPNSKDKYYLASDYSFNNNEDGYQDQCIFKFNKDLIEHLVNLNNLNKYIENKKEYQFLDILYYLDSINKNAICYSTIYDIYSYNTIEELKEIENKIKK